MRNATLWAVWNLPPSHRRTPIRDPALLVSSFRGTEVAPDQPTSMHHSPDPPWTLRRAMKSVDCRCGSLVFDVNEGVGCGQEDKGCSWLRGWAEYAAPESALPSNGSGFADDSTRRARERVVRRSPGRNGVTPERLETPADRKKSSYRTSASTSNIAAGNRLDTARFRITLMENCCSGSFVNVGGWLDAA